MTVIMKLLPCTQPSNKDEYCVANQLECDNIDYKITYDITANQKTIYIQ